MWLSREMGGYVDSAPACYGSSLGSNPDNSQKYKMGDISKGLANPPKKYTKKFTHALLQTCSLIWAPVYSGGLYKFTL